MDPHRLTSRNPTVTVIRHSVEDNLGSLPAGLAAAGRTLRVILAPEAHASDWQEARTAGLLIVMGGPMGVNDAPRLTYLQAEQNLLAHRIRHDLPTLGICLGSQLIASAAGTHVVPSGRQEIGWYPVSPTDAATADPLTTGLDWTIPVFHWHGDTFALPPKAQQLFSSDRFDQQGFRLGQRVYALQFHPEMRSKDVGEWIAAEAAVPYGKEDGIQSTGELVELGQHYGPASEGLFARILERFCALYSEESAPPQASHHA